MSNLEDKVINKLSVLLKEYGTILKNIDLKDVSKKKRIYHKAITFFSTLSSSVGLGLGEDIEEEAKFTCEKVYKRLTDSFVKEIESAGFEDIVVEEIGYIGEYKITFTSRDKKNSVPITIIWNAISCFVKIRSYEHDLNKVISEPVRKVMEDSGLFKKTLTRNGNPTLDISSREKLDIFYEKCESEYNSCKNTADNLNKESYFKKDKASLNEIEKCKDDYEYLKIYAKALKEGNTWVYPIDDVVIYLNAKDNLENICERVNIDIR